MTCAVDPAERTVIAATAWIAVVERALALGSHWIGASKLLLREVLDAHGGPLLDGYRVAGERSA